jgi:hypothetical protein
MLNINQLVDYILETLTHIPQNEVIEQKNIWIGRIILYYCSTTIDCR